MECCCIFCGSNVRIVVFRARPYPHYVCELCVFKGERLQ